MSENKCQFHEGDMVMLLPFDDLSSSPFFVNGRICGIDREYWENTRKRNPYKIAVVHAGGEAVQLKGASYWWPFCALKLEPAGPTVEDLL